MNIAYLLCETLSKIGTVSRRIISVDENSCLMSIEEVHRLVTDSHTSVKVSEDSLISMNLWRFTPKAFGLFNNRWQYFQKEISHPTNDEFGLANFINSAVKNDQCEVKVLVTNTKWHGILDQMDKPLVEKIPSL